MPIIDTDRCMIIHEERFANFSIIRYGVPEPRESCAWCGSRPGRFVYATDYSVTVSNSRRAGPGSLCWTDEKAFCAVGCWRAFTS